MWPYLDKWSRLDRYRINKLIEGLVWIWFKDCNDYFNIVLWGLLSLILHVGVAKGTNWALKKEEKKKLVLWLCA